MYATPYRLVFIIVAALVYLAGSSPALSGDRAETGAAVIRKHLEQLEYNFPQQKVFLHTDKEAYLAGESIWLKAYLVNATTHQPDTLSTNLYVELINTRNEIVTILLMRLRNGMAHGDIALPDSLSEGNYQFRAYTDWMSNFDEDFFFSSDIYVYNPAEASFIKRWDVVRNRFFNRSLARTQENMQFAFFPEGGNLLAGLENRVAFKAANGLGAGVSATGILLDNRNNEVLEFSTMHNGMGMFSFTPQAGKQYTARITFDNGQTKRLSLPAAKISGYRLQVLENDHEFIATITTNFNTEDYWEADQVILLAQSRGRVVFVEEAKISDGFFRASVPKGIMPDGITHFTLFTAQGQPIGERLVFYLNPEHPYVVDADIVLPASPAEDELLLNIGLKQPRSGGSYSLAVLDTHLEEPDSGINIAAWLLLVSDLGQRIENAAFYLEPDDAARQAVDLLMMTHGWRRFDWNKILKAQYPEIVYGFPKGISFVGKVSPRSSERETGFVNVELAVYQDGVDILSTTTDREGNFAFRNLDYEGLFTATLRLDQRYERRSMRVDLAARSLDEIRYTKNFDTQRLRITSRGDDWQRVSRPETVMKSRGLFEPSKETVSLYRDVDQVIYFEDIREQHSSVMDVLRTRVRGLRVVGGEIQLRGPSSLRYSNEPIFMIDEIMVDRASFLNVSIHEVDRITVISGPQSAILGSRGANGALILYTRRGDGHRHQSYEYLLKGFHKPSETFTSKINSDIHNKMNVERTLYWEPNLNMNPGVPLQLNVPVDEYTRNIRIVLQSVDSEGKITFFDAVKRR